MTSFTKTLCLAAALVLAASTGVMAKNFKMALGDAAGGTQDAAGKKFKEEFEARTKHKIKMFHNGQLGSEQATVNDAAMGTLDFSVLAINNITPFSPTVGMLTLPYMILSLDEAVQLTQGEVGQELTETTIRDSGVRIVAWSYAGFRVLGQDHG
jgi:TRAP-type C4-dicarboxylate transport system substrate-binding protein